MRKIIKIYMEVFLLITAVMGLLFCYGLIHRDDKNRSHKPIIEISSVIVFSSLLLLV